jgi:hypothetical protein
MLGESGRARMRKTKTVKTTTKTAEHLPGHVQKRFVRCGKTNCRCAVSSNKHAAFYRIWFENGRRVQRYVRQQDVETINAACQKNRNLKAKLRRGRAEYRQNLAEIRLLLKGIF